MNNNIFLLNNGNCLKFNKNQSNNALQASFSNNSIAFSGNAFFEKQSRPIKEGDLEGVKSIRNLHILGDGAETLLHKAVEQPNIEITEYLLSKINCNQKDRRGVTSFNNACLHKNLEAIKLLAQHGALVNTQDNTGNSPLHNIIPNEEGVKLLLTHKADPNVKNNFGQTPMHISYNDLSLLGILNENGGNLDLRDNNGQTLLHYAAEENNLELISFLADRKANFNISDSNKETPLFLAKNMKTINLLIDNDANIDHQNNNGETLLHKAVKTNNKELLAKLLDCNANVNLEDSQKKTPIFYSSDREQVAKLLKKGADPNHRDKNGQTLLHKYSAAGDIDKINLLLESGGNPSIKDNQGLTPFDVAEKNEKYAVSNVFKSGSRGLAKVIGMTELKETLVDDVINPLKKREEYEKYGLRMSNGILLHGLPGCGKTFVAEALAEETGRHFISLKPSDVGSSYARETTANIRDKFEEAIRNSPSIIFIDEIEGLAPSRDTLGSGDYAADLNNQVTELLQQLNNCSKNNVFVIAATNNPEKVDSAMKRTGRLDKKIFVPPPDLPARIGLFRKELENRPHDSSINYKHLAEKTPYYTPMDINVVVNTAAKVAHKASRDIGQADLLDALKKIKPSLTARDIQKYKSKVPTADSFGIDAQAEEIKPEIAKGFDKVAGMKELKQTLARDVIIPLKEPGLSRKYGIEAANGILMYGPPGCGKTFVAEALAEETGRHFTELKPSSVGSMYQHETALNIKNAFEDAIYNSPSIIFIDEIEALAPSRTHSHGMSSDTNEQVTELLQQLNNCSKNNVFVIAASNEPQKIDAAIRRVGRFDKTVFVPPPDKEARKELFQQKLKGIYAEKGIDFDLLADKTKNFTAPEILRSVIQNAAKKAMEEKARISQKHLTEQIASVKPQLSDEIVEYYRQKIDN